MSTILERIQSKIIVKPDTNCLLWTGSKDRGGYGQIEIQKKSKKVHRVIYELNNGPIPGGALVCHKCDTPACCNINHLELGTHLSNMQDKIKRGRYRNGDTGRTHCRKGHEYNDENTYYHKNGRGRVCRTCRRFYDSKRKRT